MPALKRTPRKGRTTSSRPSPRGNPSPKRTGAVVRGKQETDTSAVSTQVNQELYKRNAELAIRNKTLALLRKLDEISMATLGVDDMAREITSVIATELGYELVTIALIDDKNDGKHVEWVSLSSPLPEMTKTLAQLSPREVEVSLSGESLVARVIREKKQKMGADSAAVYPVTILHAIRAPFGGKRVLTSSLVSPLRVGNSVLGVLTFSAGRDLNTLSRYEQESISGIIGLVSLALSKAKIYEDLQRTTSQLQVANKQLEQLDKAKSEFLSIASHQLYTPLTAIKGYLSMMQEGDFGETPGKQRPIVDIVRQSSDRLIDLIRNLLDVSRIESGRLELSMESIDFVQMTRDLVTELAPNAQRKNLVLSFEAPSKELSHVVGDAQRLRQVLLNTVDNSIKYTLQGRVDVRIVQEGDTLVFSVKDTGKGIAPEEIGQLFTKFTRVGGSDRFHTEGSGLGLYVARQIVHEHRGDVWAESPGREKGSTFFVRLPIEGSEIAPRVGMKMTVGIKAAEAGKSA